MKSHSEEKERLNLYLPKELLDDLRRLIPARDRTKFITEILRRELRRKKQLEAIDQSYGAWRDEDHPELAGPGVIDHWIAEGRKGWERLDEE